MTHAGTHLQEVFAWLQRHQMQQATAHSHSQRIAAWCRPHVKGTAVQAWTVVPHSASGELQVGLPDKGHAAGQVVQLLVNR